MNSKVLHLTYYFNSLSHGNSTDDTLQTGNKIVFLKISFHVASSSRCYLNVRSCRAVHLCLPLFCASFACLGIPPLISLGFNVLERNSGKQDTAALWLRNSSKLLQIRQRRLSNPEEASMWATRAEIEGIFPRIVSMGNLMDCTLSNIDKGVIRNHASTVQFDAGFHNPLI